MIFGMSSPIPSFASRACRTGGQLRRTSIESVQINVGKLCNQACLHCHVDAGPKRTEIMDRSTLDLALDLVRAAGAHTVDITGGAPELNPSFRYAVQTLRDAGRRVIDRCNLTVLFEPGQEDLAEFLARMGVEIIASLPCYSEENVTKQRGQGVYDKSIQALRTLNALGYGRDDSGLSLTLVYNPVGPHLPPPQDQLQADYKRELGTRFGLVFNQLYTITNMPIARFAHSLERDGQLDAYMQLLVEAFNPATLDGLMGHDQPLDGSGDGRLKLLNRLFLALGDEDRHARGQLDQFEQRLEGRNVPVLRPLDMLEAHQLVEGQGGERGQVGGIELSARDGEHEIAGMNQRREQHHGPFGLETQGLGGEVLDAQQLLDQLGSIDDLAVTLPVHPVEDVSGIFRSRGIESGAVEETEGIEYRRTLSGLRRARDPAQRVLGRLSAVAGRDQHREGGVVRCLFGKVAFEADAGDRVDEIAEVDALGRRDSRDLAKRMALGPFEKCLAVPLMTHFKGRAHVLLKPGDQVAKEAVCF